MASSFVKFKGKGFWSRDGNLEDWLLCLVDTVDSVPAADTWLNAAREHWRAQATAGMTGCIDVKLDEVIQGDDGRQAALLEIAETALRRLEAGQFSLTTNPSGFARVDESVRDYVLGVADLWVKLLKGELETDVSSPRTIVSVRT